MSYGTEGCVLGPTVGCWCETSDDFDLLIELIAHATSMLRVAHEKLTAHRMDTAPPGQPGIHRRGRDPAEHRAQ